MANRERQVRRRRAVAGAVRDRLVAVRLSAPEWAAVAERAGLAGLALGAWVGQVAVEACDPRSDVAAGLPDLLRLHADLAEVLSRAGDAAAVEDLLGRLDAVIDAIVAAPPR